MGHVGSKTGSLGQISEKPCVSSRGHIFSLIHMKLGQNVCLNGISDEFKTGSLRSKTRSLDQTRKKKLVHAQRPYLPFDTHETRSECLS